MENPYAQAAAPIAATPEQQKVLDYELAVARNTDYYLPKFQRFDNDESRAGWHWPAFFVTSGWYLYRKMWLWGSSTCSSRSSRPSSSASSRLC